MNGMNYAGLDIHKKSISWCVRQADGTIIQESTIAATRQALDEWVRRLPQPWMAGMEATLFSGWIYDHLVSGGAVVKVAHPAMLQAIAAGKKKNDRVDARKIADLLRCDYFPECHMASREIRDRRRVLRYRNLLVRQAVQMKNKVSGLLMEAGVPYNQQKVHQKQYFAELLQKAEEGDAAIDAGIITIEPIDGSSYGDATAAHSGTGKGCPEDSRAFVIGFPRRTLPRRCSCFQNNTTRTSRAKSLL